MSDWVRVPLDTPRIEERGAMTIAGIRERYAFEGFDFAVFPAQLQRMKDQLGGVSERVGEAIYDVFWDMFGDADAFEYLAGVEISEGSKLPDDFRRVHLPARRYAMFRNLGNADPRNSLMTIWYDWLPASGYGLARGPQFLYVYGEDFDPETNVGKLEIWLPLKD